MQPRITVITLGVDYLERAIRFYRDGLGLQTEGIVGTEFAHGAVAFFDLQGGLRLALWPRESLAHDARLAGIAPVVADSGEGRWTAMEASEQGVPAPVMSLALMMRFASQDKGAYTDRLLAMMRNSFGGHAVTSAATKPKDRA